MSPAIITLIAWAPFLLLLLILGIVYPIFGYKRGAARAGISLAVTALSTVLSVLFAKLLSGSLVGFIKPIVDDMMSGIADKMIGAEFVTELAMGLASALCALVLFIPIFIFVISLLKPITNVIVKSFIKDAKHIANKLGGLFVAILDAVLVCLIVLLPLYGTLNIAKKATPLFEGEKELYTYVSAATDPFIVDVAGVPPFSTVYDSLFSFNVAGEKFDFSKVVKEGLTLANDVKTFMELEDKFSDPGVIKNLLSADPDVIKSMKTVVTGGLIDEEQLGEMGPIVSGVIDVVFDSLIELKLTDDEAQKEAEAICGIMGIVESLTSDTPDPDMSLEETVDNMIVYCADSKILGATLDKLTEGGESDPTGIFSNLDNNVKEAIGDKLDSYINENGASDSLEALKLFMGIQ